MNAAGTIARQIHQDAGLTGRYDGLTPIEDVFTADEIRDFDRRIGPPVGVGGAVRWAEFVQFSLTPILIGIFASVACALPGNFLILRRQALIGDAISHVVLPGIVVAFLLTGLVAAMPMLLGAAARRRGRCPDRTGQARRAGRTGRGDGRGLHHALRRWAFFCWSSRTRHRCISTSNTR
jgi:hypothetical protein